MNRFSGIVQLVFFGNYFYGLCAVALAAEASLQAGHSLHGPLFYLLVFCATVIYYNKAYLATEASSHASNLRSAWYARNLRLMRTSQLVLIAIFITAGVLLLPNVTAGIAEMTSLEWILTLVFPLVTAFYYGFRHGEKAYNIRNVGWLKPFVIGFSWAGLVNYYPVLYHHMIAGGHLQAEMSAVFLFVKNFMFISVLCIMFDIKDYEMDYNLQLKTFVVKMGPRATIWLVIIPLCIMGLVSFLFYAHLRDFTSLRIIVNTIPFVLITAVAASLHRERNIFFYLVIIDGLMLVKALCGIAGTFMI